MKGANGFSIGQIPEQLLLIIQNTRAVLIYGKTMFFSTLYRFLGKCLYSDGTDYFVLTGLQERFATTFTYIFLLFKQSPKKS